MIPVVLVIEGIVLILLAMTCGHLLIRVQALEGGSSPASVVAGVEERLVDYVRSQNGDTSSSTIVLALSSACSACQEYAVRLSDRSAVVNADYVLLETADSTDLARFENCKAEVLPLPVGGLSALGVRLTPLAFIAKNGTIVESAVGEGAARLAFGPSAAAPGRHAFG